MEYEEGRAESGETYQVNVHELQTRDFAQWSPPKSVLRTEPRQSFGVWRVPLGDGPMGTLLGTWCGRRPTFHNKIPILKCLWISFVQETGL